MDFKYLILNTELKDDNTQTGGKNYEDETLLEFLEETNMSPDSKLGTINYALIDCGILPINEFNYPELFKYTFRDLSYYIAGGYDYIDCFNYIRNDIKKEVSYVEELVIQNLEKNSIRHPYEFGELIATHENVELKGQLSI